MTDTERATPAAAPPAGPRSPILPRTTAGKQRDDLTVRPDRVAASRGNARAPEWLPYQLVDRPEPPPVPNGWYALASSSDLLPGEPLTVIALERELVLFRDAGGEARVVDAFCPHMGAHLGGGDVVDGALACPYHGWRFGPDGQCVEIPYSDARIPAKACVRSWEVLERNGMVLVWYHAGGAAPTYEVPEIPEVDDPGFTDAVVHRGELIASLQDMAENNVDYTHFFFVHGRNALDESTSKFTTDGPLSTVVETFDDGLTFTRYTYGPGIALLRAEGLMTVLTATTAIDRRHVRLLWHFHLPPAMAEFADDVVASVTGEHGLGADAPIWRDKVFRDRPLLVKGDGPITEFRRWYAQFYEGND
jgi:phenylpropionate dioxygenase-like ring-hydroxylating dioxygenase large terminal subunit